MKKAKLMLSAIGIFAVLGTAFAFKAQTFTGSVIFTGSKDGGVCTTRTTFATITTGTGTVVAASTSSLSSGCPNAKTIANDN